MMEALGLAIFMISACFFGGILESKASIIHRMIPGQLTRNIIMGCMMGLTALFIFYSPWTAASGAHINPAVTFAFLRAGRINKHDSFFYILFQFIGGTAAVYIMQSLMGSTLTAQPVNSVVTIPGRYGTAAAFFMELSIAFIMMSMVMFTSTDEKLKKYTRAIAACMVCIYVIIAGPVSGFGMNPARSFASALPAHTWTAFWLYMTVPVAGMMLAVEFFLFVERKKNRKQEQNILSQVSQKKKMFEPLEFVL